MLKISLNLFGLLDRLNHSRGAPRATAFPAHVPTRRHVILRSPDPIGTMKDLLLRTSGVYPEQSEIRCAQNVSESAQNDTGCGAQDWLPEVALTFAGLPAKLFLS